LTAGVIDEDEDGEVTRGREAIEGRITLRGTQRTGWDAQRKQFRMGVFDDRGGFAEGFWCRATATAG